MRPDGTDNESFPSGHTSVAFCGATTLMHEYRKVSPWIGVAGYAVATGVAVDRVRRNRHHWEDVVAGAAIGVASAEAGYLIGDWILGKNTVNIRYHIGFERMMRRALDNFEKLGLKPVAGENHIVGGESLRDIVLDSGEGVVDRYCL